MTEAALAINVSCEHLAKLLDEGTIPHASAEGERAIAFSELIAYKDNRDKGSRVVMNELAAQAQDLKMGYE